MLCLGPVADVNRFVENFPQRVIKLTNPKRNSLILKQHNGWKTECKPTNIIITHLITWVLRSEIKLMCCFDLDWLKVTYCNKLEQMLISDGRRLADWAKRASLILMLLTTRKKEA
uniref:Uncharacterized protein n=1 Tax=Romanomermis culicivorax TaxID=13658 RepID=A0A915KPF4_ROMCU